MAQHDILHVTHRYWPFTGGSERYVTEIAERWAVASGRSAVYTTDAWDLAHLWEAGHQRIPLERELHQGVAVTRFPVGHPRLARWRFAGLRRLCDALPGPAWPVARYLSRCTPPLPELHQALSGEQLRPSLVHGWNITLDGLLWPAWELARRRKIPFVVTPFLHLGRGKDRRQYTAPHRAHLLAAADRVIAMTRMEAEALAELGVATQQITIAPPGITPRDDGRGDAQAFRAEHQIRGSLLGYLGPLDRAKGVYDVIAAVEILLGQGREVTLALAGPSGPAAVTAFLSQCPPAVRSGCRLLGYIDEAQKADLLAALDILVVPSSTESFGIVYLEAWCYGKPVIGAQAGAVPEVIDDGVDGYCVPPGQPPVLAQRIETLLAQPELRRQMGATGRSKALAHYTWEHTYQVLEQVYRDLL